MRNLVIVVTFVLFSAAPIHADDTEFGTIMEVQGHISPSCIMVLHSSGEWFRIGNWNVPGAGASIQSVALAALLTGRPVSVHYTPGRTTGCGTEPMIDFIRMQ